MNHFGATILDADGLRLSAEEKAFFRAANPFGFILCGRNIDTGNQVRALCADMREAVGRDAPILIDQEGGRVQRLRPPLARDWLPPLDFVERAGGNAERAMYLRGRLTALELQSYGIDTNCAPMLDLARDETHAFLKNRCYGSDPDTVSRLARAIADGHLDGGVLPVAKHVPGHGRAVADSHFDLPHVDVALEELSDLDFEPFRALADLPMGMTAHIVFDQIAPEPATLSPEMITLIRDDIGFDGLLMTDDISMKALSGSFADLTRGSLEAGCDVVLVCNQSLESRREVAEAAGEMGDAAQARADAALSARKPAQPLDIDAAEAELAALVQRGQGDG